MTRVSWEGCLSESNNSPVALGCDRPRGRLFLPRVSAQRFYLAGKYPASPVLFACGRQESGVKGHNVMIFHYREASPFGREASHDWANLCGEFQKLLLGLGIAGSWPTGKGFAAEPLQMNSPPSGPKVLAAVAGEG